MGCKDRNLHLNEGRGCNGGGDDVVCRRRYAHAENQGGNHCKEHRRNHFALRKVKKGRSKFQADAGLCDDANDDAC